MGTDYLQLFNKEVADKILAMELEPMTQFLELNIEFLKRKNRETILRSSVQFVMAEAGCSTKEAIATLLERDEKLSEIRVSLALDSGFSTERISLDYWGCYAEVFDGSPEGSISCLEYLPNEV